MILFAFGGAMRDVGTLGSHSGRTAGRFLLQDFARVKDTCRRAR